MLKIQSLDDVRGNSVVIYTIKNFLEKHTLPKFLVLAGNMGVGKSTVARLIADEVNSGEFKTVTYNFGLSVDMGKIESDVFKMNPSVPRAFVFEEIHGLNKDQQTALLNMMDTQPDNVHIICTTTELYKIQLTIRSRATVLTFKLLSERLLSQLLDDYLKDKDKVLTPEAKLALLKSCHGVPRDLLKNTDLILSGDFTYDQLSELLGQVSEDMVFTVFCALKSQSIDFASSISSLVDGSTKEKLLQLRDFFTRFLLERKGIEGATLSADKIATLDSLYSNEELERICRTLIRAKPDTLVLELQLLNMELTRTSSKYMVGQQIDRASSNTAQASARNLQEVVQERVEKSRLSRDNIAQLHFD